MKSLIGYGLLALIGLAGMLAVVACTVKGETTLIHWIVSMLSMALILIAVRCYQDERTRK